MEDNVDTLIKEWCESNPLKTGPLDQEEIQMLQRRLIHLLGTDTLLLVNHFPTQDGLKIKKFINDQVDQILKRMGRDETTILRDILTQLTIDDGSLQRDIMNQAMSELEDS